jgi:hypothetical protein
MWTAFESSLPEGLLLMLNDARNRLNSVSTPASVNLATEIAEAEYELESIQGMRTMATDARAVQPVAVTPPGETIHTSSQVDILPQREDPKWGSE